MLRAEGAFVPGARLLAELQGGAHLPGGVISASQEGAGRQRVRMTGSQGLLPAGQCPLAQGDGIPGLTRGQAGAGEPEPGGQGARVIRPAQTLPVGQ